MDGRGRPGLALAVPRTPLGRHQFRIEKGKKKKAHLETASARVCPGPAKEEGHV